MALRVGVIGAGSMGKHHVRIYSELPTVELVGVADIDESVAELAASHNAPFHKEYQELLKQAPELVSIAVPTSLHMEVALAALEAGCHLLIEKPISDTLDSAGAIIESAKERGRKVFVGHVERFNPAVIALKEAISSGKLGEVHSISNLRVGAYNRRIFDTGIILDLGSHDIDLISYLYGRKAEAVFALGAAKIHEYEDHAAISLKFAESAAGYIELSWLSPYKVRKMFVVGTEHFGLVDLIQQSLIVYGWTADWSNAKNRSNWSLRAWWKRCSTTSRRRCPARIRSTRFRWRWRPSSPTPRVTQSTSRSTPVSLILRR